MITTSRTITHAYNSLGQNTTKTWSGAYSNVVTMEYDDAGHQKTLSEGSGGSQLRKETTFHAWKGTPNVETFKVGGSTWKSQTHVHDLSGNYIKFTDPEGKDHEWTVDNAGRVLDVKHDGVVVMSLTYTPGGLLDTTTVKNASGSPIFKITHYYDELGRKSRQVTAKSSNGAVISAYRWEYDAGDRVVKLKLEHLGCEFVYGYDERDQLTSETTEGNSATGAPPFTNNIVSLPVGNEGAASNEPTMQTQNVLGVSARSASWTYDKAGNRTAMTIDGDSTSFSYNAGSQLTSETWLSKTVSHTYDEWGNETVRTTVEGANTIVETYGYSYLNVMSSYVRTLNSVTQSNWQYQFWPTGDRYGKVDLVTSSNSEYYVPRMGDVAADYTSTLAIKNTYVQGTGIDSKSIRIPWSGSSPDNANRKHYVSDLVGTIGMTLTETATTSETSVKDSWGNQLAGSTTERYGGLAQRETDGESSLVFVRARMYDPVRGRFTQIDPILGIAPVTQYIYGSNAPTLRVDPQGTQDWEATVSGMFWQLQETRKRYLEEEDPAKRAKLREIYDDAYLGLWKALNDFGRLGYDISKHVTRLGSVSPYVDVRPETVDDEIARGQINLSMTALGGTVNSIGFYGALGLTAAGLILEELAAGKGLGMVLKVAGRVFRIGRFGNLSRQAVAELEKAIGRRFHMFSKHGGAVTDDALRARITQEGLEAATKFKTDRLLVEAYQKVVRGNEAEIKNWLKHARLHERKEFFLKVADQGEDLGSGFIRGAGGAPTPITRPLKNAKLVLEKTGDGELHPVTFYPE